MPSRMFLRCKSNAKVYYTDNLSVCFSNLLTQTRACLTSVKQPVRLFHISLNPPRRTCLFGMPAVKVCPWQKNSPFSCTSAQKALPLQHKAVGRLAAGTICARGKSGQHRALRYLTDRSPRGLARAEENDRRPGSVGIDVSMPTMGPRTVRVRRRGKSSPGAWRHACCAHRRLKVHVNRRSADCGHTWP